MSMMSGIEPIFIKILNMSLTAGIAICIVILMRFLFRRMPKIFSYILWSAVLFRLLCPISFSSALSFFNILRVPSAQQGQIMYIPENIGFMEQPSVDFPVLAVEDSVNDALPAAEIAESANPMQIVLWAGICIWMSGIIIMTLYSIISYWKLHRKLEQAVWVQENIYYTVEVDTPFVCGFLTPRIYLPARFYRNGLSEKEEKEKSYILLHEQIHIKRRDYIWRVISYFALCLHWFNPLVWIAFFLSGKDMEMSCDEAVVRILGGDVKKEYSASLLSFASGRRIRLTSQLTFGEGETGSRIKNVLRYKKPAQIVIGIAFVVCVIAIVALAANPGNPDGSDNVGGLDNDSGTDDAGNAGDFAGEVFYGVVSYVNIGGEEETADGVMSGNTAGTDSRGIEVVMIPGLGDVEIPEAEEVYPYIEIENFTKPEEGDLLAITFPEGEEVSIQETYPSSFSVPAQSIAVMGQGFDLQRTDSGTYLFTVPWGYAQDAEVGDTLAIYYYNDTKADGGVRMPLATVSVLSVDAGNYDVWVELSVEEAGTFLANFGHGIECEIVESDAKWPEDGTNRQVESRQSAKQAEEEENVPKELTFDLLSQGDIADGTYRVYIRSISRSARGIDRYLADGAKDTEELPLLAFSQDCTFMVNREMDSLRYEEVSFEEFADLAQETFSYLNPPMLLTFRDGVAVEAVFENYYGAGISYAVVPPDIWYADKQVMRQMTTEEALEADYTLENQIYLDVSDGEGMERIEVYAANSGDNGIVLVKNAGQENLFTSIYAAGANTSRAGWNNIYLGYMDGYGFIMTLHIENRIDFGEYDYYVFRLSEDGEIAQIAGSSFYFDSRGIPYDDALFEEWTKNLGQYLEKSELILSTQDGVLRTEMVSEAEKYTYETLRPVK